MTNLTFPSFQGPTCVVVMHADATLDTPTRNYVGLSHLSDISKAVRYVSPELHPQPQNFLIIVLVFHLHMTITNAFALHYEFKWLFLRSRLPDSFLMLPH